MGWTFDMVAGCFLFWRCWDGFDWLWPFAAHALTEVRSVVLRTADAGVELRAGDDAPALVLIRLDLSGDGGLVWRNAGEEILPAHVDIDGAAVPVRWSYRWVV